MIDCAVVVERWALIEPFEIAREVMTHVAVAVVTLTDGAGHAGRGEAAGVDYVGETPESIASDVQALRARLVDDVDGAAVLRLLPAGGARNALDCALWDLRAKQSGITAATRAGLPALAPLVTAITLGLADDDAMRRKVRARRGWPIVKVKVDAHRHLDLVRLVRDESPDARLIVDANESWSRDLLQRLLPELEEMNVMLIEQPVPREEDASLEGLASRVPLAADESCTDAASLHRLAPYYNCVNIKLDKCGGLTEALRMVEVAHRLGLDRMVGNMCGTSLAMAPAFLVGQRCRYVDLDGPLLQAEDRANAMRYRAGIVEPPVAALWG